MTGGRKLVSAVIPTYNHSMYVGGGVESALAQTYSLIEVIVVDDGSSDNTQEVLAPYRDRIRYVFQKNKGLSAARNTGIREAKGEFIAFLDADDRWFPTKIEKQFEIMSRKGAVGLVGCGIDLTDENGNVTESIRAQNYPKRSVFLRELSIGNNVAGSGSGVLVRRECFQQVGVFDETLTSSEDWDMWLRIAMHYEVAFVEEPLVSIKKYAGSMSSVTNAERMLANELAVLGKHFSDQGVHYSAYLKRKAYSRQFMRAAWGLWRNGNTKRARYWITKALVTNPVYFLCDKFCMNLGIRLLIGSVRFR